MGNCLYIIVVLYNKRITEIKSIESFLNLSLTANIRVLFMDNSIDLDIKQYNKNQSKNYDQQKFLYVDNGGNIGLSRAYNKALSLIKDDNYWVMLADDDTFFSETYLRNVVFETQEKGNYLLYTGIINNGRSFFSPKKRLSIKNKASDFITEPGLYTNIYAVNSGLVINSAIFKKYGHFDETLFLDMIDFNFMKLLIKNEANTIKVLGGRIEQEFSGTTKASYKKMMSRYKIFKKDFVTFCKLNEMSQFYKIAILSKRHLNILKKAIF